MNFVQPDPKNDGLEVGFLQRCFAGLLLELRGDPLQPTKKANPGPVPSQCDQLWLCGTRAGVAPPLSLACLLSLSCLLAFSLLLACFLSLACLLAALGERICKPFFSLFLSAGLLARGFFFSLSLSLSLSRAWGRGTGQRPRPKGPPNIVYFFVCFSLSLSLFLSRSLSLCFCLCLSLSHGRTRRVSFSTARLCLAFVSSAFASCLRGFGGGRIVYAVTCVYIYIYCVRYTF